MSYQIVPPPGIAGVLSRNVIIAMAHSVTAITTTVDVTYCVLTSIPIALYKYTINNDHGHWVQVTTSYHHTLYRANLVTLQTAVLQVQLAGKMTYLSDIK